MVCLYYIIYVLKYLSYYPILYGVFYQPQMVIVKIENIADTVSIDFMWQRKIFEA